MNQMREFALLIIERKPRNVKSGCKSALRAEAEPLDVDEFAGFIYAARQIVKRLKLFELCADHPQDNEFVFWHVS